jgi:hypothetical protein
MSDIDPTPTTPTTIGDRLSWLRGDMNAKLDTIISKLDSINTTLSNGAFNPTPIVDAITNLRGVGPENTLKSLNQSIWNIAGTAPGASLLDLKTVLQKIVDTLGDPSSISPTNITVRGLLDNIQGLLDVIRGQWAAGEGLSAYSLMDAIYLLQVQELAQFNTSVVTPTMKDLLMTISQQQALIAANTTNPLLALPTDCCATPLMNTGSFFQDTTAVFVTPVTIATWPGTLGGDFTVDYDVISAAYTTIHCTDWTKYRIYVASKADSFGVTPGRGERYSCNQWITLAIPEGGIGMSGAEFNVDKANDLKVYICTVDPVFGSCPTVFDDPFIPTTWADHTPAGQPAGYWWEMTGYNSGGITWSLDMVMPNATDAMGQNPLTRNAFMITPATPTSGNNLCIQWIDGREGESLYLAQWRLTGGVWMADGLIGPWNDVSGGILVRVPMGNTVAYTMVASGTYTTPPNARFSLSYLVPV